MSLTRTVPAVVPSLFHNSEPLVPLLAEKNSVVPMTVRLKGLEPPAPGRMSLTRTVPAAVPSLFQSSVPFTLLLAVKNSVPFRLVRYSGYELPAPARMSFTKAVPAAVPSVFQSSRPRASSRAEKKIVLPTCVIWPGDDPRVPVFTFASNSGVPASSTRLSSTSTAAARRVRLRISISAELRMNCAEPPRRPCHRFRLPIAMAHLPCKKCSQGREVEKGTTNESGPVLPGIQEKLFSL